MRVLAGRLPIDALCPIGSASVSVRCAIVSGVKIPSAMLLLLALAGAPGWAAAQEALYVGEAVVEPRPDDARPALLDALNQVLVRLTGRVGEDLVGALGLDTARAEALALSRQYRRETVPRRGGAVREQRLLRVDFDPASIDALLQEAGYPRWGRERPEFLLWVVFDTGGGARYLDDEPVLDAALQRLAFRYGIGLTRPILDASDRLDVTPADVRGGFTGVAVNAVRRYGADGVIMLDLRQNRSFWTGRWAWRIGGRESAFQRSGSDPEEVLALGLGRITEALAARFAVRPADAGRRQLVVSGIRTPAQYREVVGFLQQLTGVDTVRPSSATGDAVTFELDVSTDGLRQRIELTGPLEFVRHDLSSGTLHYRFAL
jgi:hypothetical protein